MTPGARPLTDTELAKLLESAQTQDRRMQRWLGAVVLFVAAAAAVRLLQLMGVLP